jgi:antitoxin component YwqK of YwqJK toxin-antitoxin module
MNSCWHKEPMMVRFYAVWVVGVAVGSVLLAGQPVRGDEEMPGGSEATPLVVSDTASESGAATAMAWDDPEAVEPRSELIRERYPNRKIKVERQVIQDAQDNFVNHGKWKMWDPNGNIMAEGQFENGARKETWVRWLRGGESKLLATVPFRQFQAPFISQAKFENGQLNGRWTIYDAKQRKISEWNFADGQREGKWTWWYVNGRKMREIDYRNGDLDGHYRQWQPDGALTTDDTFQEGRKLARKLVYQKGSKTQKQSEGMHLYARIVPQSSDDWWNCELAKFVTEGKDEKHGQWTSWYPSNQKKLQGEFRNDVQVGTFTWWHPNGQIAAEGNYADGRQAGKWTWWHTNGQKSIQGEFAAGGPTSRWTWWKEDGKVAQRADFTHSKGRIVDVPLPKTEAVAPPRRKSVTGRFRSARPMPR